jgi:hypothetical protein
VSSCGSRVETHLALPPASDLAQEAEPPYPVEALQPGEEGRKAEEAWNARILIWGRRGWAQNARVCRWAVDLGLKVPEGYCGR